MKISILLLEKPRTREGGDQPAPKKKEGFIKSRLEALISTGWSEGISIDYYYIAYGSYKNELIQFIQEKGVTHLVLTFPSDAIRSTSENHKDLVDEIKLRTNCPIELVHQGISHSI